VVRGLVDPRVCGGADTIRVNLGGYLGLSIGWLEGLGINVLLAVLESFAPSDP
jgi:hypothetical protein